MTYNKKGCSILFLKKELNILNERYKRDFGFSARANTIFCNVPNILNDIKKIIKVLNLIADKACDSYSHKKEAERIFGVRLISLSKKNRLNNKEDGRRLRRYKRRHRVENFFADLQTYRRVVTRYEKDPENHLTFLQLTVLSIQIIKYRFYKDYGA